MTLSGERPNTLFCLDLAELQNSHSALGFVSGFLLLNSRHLQPGGALGFDDVSALNCRSKART